MSACPNRPSESVWPEHPSWRADATRGPPPRQLLSTLALLRQAAAHQTACRRAATGRVVAWQAAAAAAAAAIACPAARRAWQAGAARAHWDPLSTAAPDAAHAQTAASHSRARNPSPTGLRERWGQRR